jgi:outer membrane protein assembly factor BamB
MQKKNKQGGLMSHRMKLLVIATALSLSACSTLSALNPFSKPDPKTAPAALVDVKPSMSLKTTWRYSLASSGSYLFSPAIVGNQLYVASAGGEIAKLNAVTGVQDWKVKAGMALTAGVAASSDLVVVAGEKGALLAYDSKGQLLWKIQAATEVIATPVIAQNLVIVQSIDNRISAYDATSGARKWMIERALPILTLRNVSGIAVADQLAIVASSGGKLVALSLVNGAQRWEAMVAEPKGATELERLVDLSGVPVVVGSQVCTIAFQGKTACFDVQTGANRWTKDVSSEVGLAADERYVFATDTESSVFAFAATGGMSAWKNEQLRNRKLSTPTSFGRALVVGDSFGFLHFLSREDGSFLNRLSLDKGAIVAAPLVYESNLIVQTQSGTIVAIATE